VEKAVILARGPRVALEDLTSRRHRTADQTGLVSIPVGASLADARRQLVLQNFASAGGDLDRAAKMTGISVAEVRAELQALLERRSSDSAPPDPLGSDGRDPAESPPVALPADADTPVSKPASPKPTAAAKGRKGH